MVTTVLFLALLVGALGFGAWIGARLTQADEWIDSVMTAEQRGWDVCEEAARCETNTDEPGEL